MELSVLFSWSKLSVGCVIPKETREGWPLLTVETEVNGDSKRTNEKGPFFVGLLYLSYRTAKTQYWKFETDITRKGIAQPQSQFPHSSVCEQFIYSHDLSAYSAAGKYVDRTWEYINRSQTHECRNWDWGRANSFLGIYKWDFRCSAVQNNFLL